MILRQKAKWLTLLAAILIIPILILTGCNNPPITSSNSQSNTPSSPPNTQSSASSQSQTPMTTPASILSGSISEVGSTTVQPLAEKIAAAFTAINPQVKVDIKGGGSSVGIKAANDGTADIGGSSRELTKGQFNLVKSLAEMGSPSSLIRQTR